MALIKIVAPLRDNFDTHYPNPVKVFAMFAVAKALELATPQELPGLFKSYNDRGWFRLISSAKSLKRLVPHSPVKAIGNQLKKFKPISGF